MQDLSMRVVNLGRPADQSLPMQGVLLIYPCWLPQKLDQQQGQEVTQRYRAVLQFLKV